MLCKRNNNIKKLLRYIFITTLLLFALPIESVSSFSDETSLKAAYLERFTRFIENKKFPEFDNINSNFRICIIGKSDYNEIFDEIYSKQTIKNRDVELRYVNEFKEIKKFNPNLIFITKEFSGNIEQIVEYSNKMGILTVSERIGMAKRGIHINLYNESQRLKFEINLKSAQEAGFSISHLLLKNSRLVE